MPTDDESSSSAISRRAPFSDNPTVGLRGQRTLQRILDSALVVFGTEGYHSSSIGSIAKHAGCSRVTFYQYFAGKEDVFSHLAGQVMREVGELVEALEPVGADAAGWAELRRFLSGYGDIYERYGSVFHIFETAVESTKDVQQLRVAASTANVRRVAHSLIEPTLPSADLRLTVGLMLDATARVYYDAHALRSVEPTYYPRDRLENALTDVWHRTLFGLRPEVNVHTSALGDPPTLAFAPAMREMADARPAAEMTEIAHNTRETLLSAGHEVFVERGYHSTRVDDVVEAAGLSHGAFYRYFDNKAHFARTLVLDAIEPLSSALTTIPAVDPSDEDAAALTAWIRRAQQRNATQRDSDHPSLDRRDDARAGARHRCCRRHRLGTAAAGHLPRAAGLRRCRCRSLDRTGVLRRLRCTAAIRDEPHRRRSHHRTRISRSLKVARARHWLDHGVLDERRD